MGRSPCSNACQLVSAFPLHTFRVFVLMQLITSPFPLLPDVSCLAYSLLLALPFVLGLSLGSGQRQTSASPLPTAMAMRSPEHHALCPFTGLQHSAPGDTCSASSTWPSSSSLGAWASWDRARMI